MAKAIEVIALHLYLPRGGEDENAQLKTVAQLCREHQDAYVLIGGGWSGTDYKQEAGGKPAFAPEYLRARLMELGVPENRIRTASRDTAPCWRRNVVSTWGEVLQMLGLLETLCQVNLTHNTNLTFVGHPTHMARAIGLWRYWGKCLCPRMHIDHVSCSIPVAPDPKWLKGEWLRNLIAHLDPGGHHIAAFIHALRRRDARWACPLVVR